MVFEWFFAGLFAGGVGGWLVREWIELRISKEAERQRLASISGKGVAARQEAESRMEAAMLKIAVGMKEGKDVQTLLKETAAEYPDVALRLAKKVGFSL